MNQESSEQDELYVSASEQSRHKLQAQDELSNLVRDLGLTKNIELITRFGKSKMSALQNFETVTDGLMEKFEMNGCLCNGTL